MGDPSAGLALPARMAPVNAMLDVASPALREALLIAFLDRLSRPVRWVDEYPDIRVSCTFAGVATA